MNCWENVLVKYINVLEGQLHDIIHLVSNGKMMCTYVHRQGFLDMTNMSLDSVL